MPTREEFLRLAIGLATDNVSHGGGPFGAVVARGEERIATGVNRVTATNDPTAHAEVVAIRTACSTLGTFDLRGCTLYTSCEPCPMCLAAALWGRLDAIVYGATAEDAAAAGFDDSHFYAEVRKPVGGRALPMHNLLRGEAGQSFQAWRAHSERIDY